MQCALPLGWWKQRHDHNWQQFDTIDCHNRQLLYTNWLQHIKPIDCVSQCFASHLLVHALFLFHFCLTLFPHVLLCIHRFPYLSICLTIPPHFSKFLKITSKCLNLSQNVSFEQFWAVLSRLSSFEQFWAVLSNFEQFWAILSRVFGQFWAIWKPLLSSFFFACFKCKFCSTLWTHLNSFQVGSWQSQVLYWLQLLYWGFKFAVGMLSSSIMLQSEIVWYV